MSNFTVNYFTVPVDALPEDMVYGLTNRVMIVVYSLLMLASLLVNLIFISILIRRRHRTRTHYLMINLCLSNFYLVLVEMPLQIAWNTSVMWTGSDGLCRALAYLSIIGLYGNAFFTVAIALDRWQSISRTTTKGKLSCFELRKQRTRCMIALAWIMAHLCSVPQAIIFHVEEHPNYKNFYQCVTFNYFTKYQEIAYNLGITCLIYCVPLLALLGCSLAIWVYIHRHAEHYRSTSASTTASNASTKPLNNTSSAAKRDSWAVNGQRPSIIPPSPSLGNRLQDRTMRFRCSTKRLLCRAERQAFRLTVVFLLIFIGCHTPYQIISVWRVLNPSLSEWLNPIVHRLLFACGVLPTIVDPVAYAKFLIPITNELKIIMNRRLRSQSGGQASRRSRTNSPMEPEDPLAVSQTAASDGAKKQLLAVAPAAGNRSLSLPVVHGTVVNGKYTSSTSLIPKGHVFAWT
ncbi:gonadotropin-releasing hormone II receptor-like [Paramacrobiotus metropolitanus]|uniref:gonadotropin-releasing hormone II receptor-like n=1 Tax=Paramacrobiotus metropolitanus TaxID=2943436 RepID=UPI002446278B|nr:gonadotropin-releasing hormone II receptor-like [Paramacrobiotus metropolitanus]